ncbi:MAG TPA: response regulator transcription factor, partial [Solirubrobacterales bacterium]|nr:response regulator transcription factor [Solirubrobacterales bacterium]
MDASTSQPARILVVEDDEATRTSLVDGLRLDGHEVLAADGAAMARRVLARNRVDLVLLDVNLPDDSGYSLLRELRVVPAPPGAVNTGVPVLMVSGRGSEVDRVRGFELGCDDYIVKPYSFTELRGRIAAVLRRAGDAAVTDIQQVGELVIDRRTRAIQLAGRQVMLTIKEHALLLALAEDPHRVFTRDELLQSVWGFQSKGTTRTLDAHACRLRAKL